MDIPFIYGEKVYLRAVEPEDAEILAKVNNQPEVRYSFFIAFPTNAHRQREFIKELYEKRIFVPFIICEKESKRAIGYTAFHNVDLVSRCTAYSIRIADPADWGRGYASEVTRLMISYGFETLNLNRIQLHVCTDNERGIRAYKKAGFQIEGTLKEAMYHDDKYCDFHLMALLRKEYYERKSQEPPPPERPYPTAY